jgi:hypothetical protein
MPLEWFPKAFLLYAGFIPGPAFLPVTQADIYKADFTKTLPDVLMLISFALKKHKKIEVKGSYTAGLMIVFAFQICMHFLTLIFNPKQKQYSRS